MTYTITGTATFSKQVDRDAAKARLDIVLLTYPTLVPKAFGSFAAGVAMPTNTTMTVSFEDGVDGTTAAAAAQAIYESWIGTGNSRNTLGYLSVNSI